jgi:hypothetical protein
LNMFRHADKFCFASMVQHFHHAGDLLHHTVDVFASWSFFTCDCAVKICRTVRDNKVSCRNL